MKRMADQTFTYTYQREEGQNPYIGFMSFQHFRGEKMYSDIIVTPEARMTETERVECYPVSDDAEENGREQGYYPDTSVVYIRILWKEWEPERGVYNHAFIKTILEEARAHGQTLIFRLMAHSTRACDDVPEWLKAICDCPERPPMARVKDSPTDPIFIDLFLEAVRKFGEAFDADPTLDAVDISMPGAWGEGHKLELYPDGTYYAIIDAYLEAFPETQLITQVARPELVAYAARKGRCIGWRGDGLGEPHHIQTLYPQKVEKMGDNWKVAPVSFESYWWLCEWQRRDWPVDQIIQTTLDWHLSSFNAKSIPCPSEWQDKIDAWVAQMGYHYTINAFHCPARATPGDEIDIRLEAENVGVAPMYKNLPVVLKLKGERQTVEYELDVKLRDWLPGRHSVQACIALPAVLAPGAYAFTIEIQSPHAEVVYFATDARRCGAAYAVGTMDVE